MPGFNKLHEIAAGMPERGAQIVAAYAGYWENAASQLAPVDTGDLRNSVSHEITGPHEAKVFASMEYAEYQEYGTQDMPAQPFMRPARNALVDSWKRDLKRVFNQ